MLDIVFCEKDQPLENKVLLFVKQSSNYSNDSFAEGQPAWPQRGVAGSAARNASQEPQRAEAGFLPEWGTKNDELTIVTSKFAGNFAAEMRV